MPSARAFYDGLAPDYDVLFPDWWAAAVDHGEVVARVLASLGVQPPASVLDCTCGIGTQALPLAQAGFAVTGTDVSGEAVERARAEAGRRGLDVDLRVADVRSVRDAVAGEFDAVVSCDNALAHLLTDDDLNAALAAVRSCLRDDGVLVVSLRDYDALRRDRPTGTPVVLHGPPGARWGSGQAWSWSDDGEHVDVALFTLREGERGWETRVHETRSRALRRGVVQAALERAGFADVRWREPSETGYYQPVVVARAVPC